MDLRFLHHDLINSTTLTLSLAVRTVSLFSQSALPCMCTQQQHLVLVMWLWWQHEDSRQPEHWTRFPWGNYESYTGNEVSVWFMYMSIQIVRWRTLQSRDDGTRVILDF